jgi:anti-sigma B factor antagonist
MKTSTRQVSEVTILDLIGPLTQQEGSGLLREAVRQLTSEGHRKILLNLDSVSEVDTSGIGELVSAFSTLRQHGGELKLLKLSEGLRDLLETTKLHQVFDVRDDEASAIQAFSKSA